MKVFKHIALIAAVVFTTQAIAQQIPLSEQYFINKYAFSPAMAGHNNNVEGFLSYRKSWTGVAGSPETKMFNMNGRIFENMGLGGSLISDQIGIFRTLSAQASYAYRLKLGGTQNLNFGVNAGVLESRIMLSEQTQENLNDPIALSNMNVNQVVFDMSFGIHYQFDRFHAGVYIPRMVETKVDETIMNENTTLYTLKRHYQIYSSYTYTVSRDLHVEPSLVVRTDLNSPVFYQVSALAKYRKQVWLGFTYFKQSYFGLAIGGMPHSNLVVNYGYEFGGNGMLAQSTGTHEVSVGFLIGSKENTLSSIFNADLGSRKRPYFDWINKQQ